VRPGPASPIERKLFETLFTSEPPPAKPSNEPERIQFGGENVRNPKFNQPVERPANELGALAGQTKLPSLQISDAVLVKQLGTLIMPPAQHADLLCQAVKEILAIQKIIDEHSPVLADRKVSALSDRYAQDPSPENFEALRHAKTLSPADHGLVQQHQQQKRRAIYDTIAVPARAILAKAAKALADKAQSMMTSERAIHGAWGQPVQYSPLLRGLAIKAKALAMEADCPARLDQVPTLVEAVMLEYTSPPPKADKAATAARK